MPRLKSSVLDFGLAEFGSPQALRTMLETTSILGELLPKTPPWERSVETFLGTGPTFFAHPDRSVRCVWSGGCGGSESVAHSM